MTVAYLPGPAAILLLRSDLRRRPRTRGGKKRRGRSGGEREREMPMPSFEAMDAEDGAPARINRSVINVPGIRGMEEIWQPTLYTPRPAPPRDGTGRDGTARMISYCSLAAGIVTPSSVNDDAVSSLLPPPLSSSFCPPHSRRNLVASSPLFFPLYPLFDDYIFPIYIYIFRDKF